MVTTTRKFKGTRAYTNVIKVAFYLVSELVFDQGGEKTFNLYSGGSAQQRLDEYRKYTSG